MRDKLRIAVISLFLMLGVFITTRSFSQTTVSFQIFYDELSPYGDWVYNPDYGYVWVPSVTAGFAPYSTNGYWIMTEDGWTWVSNYSWGWAPFHYGRWYSDPSYGPMWVPGYDWGPGWVVWRRSETYYGWAPIGPGVSADIAYGNSYNVPYNNWTYVESRNFGRRNSYNYYVNASRRETLYKSTTIINNTRVDKTRNITYNPGPDRNEVAKRLGKPINQVTIKDRSKPGSRLRSNELEVYRPRLQSTASSSAKPSRITDLKDVKPMGHRLAPNQLTNTQLSNQNKKSRLSSKPTTTQPGSSQKIPSRLAKPKNTDKPVVVNPPTSNNHSRLKQNTNVPQPIKSVKKVERSDSPKRLQNSKNTTIENQHRLSTPPNTQQEHTLTPSRLQQQNPALTPKPQQQPTPSRLKQQNAESPARMQQANPATRMQSQPQQQQRAQPRQIPQQRIESPRQQPAPPNPQKNHRLGNEPY